MYKNTVEIHAYLHESKCIVWMINICRRRYKNPSKAFWSSETDSGPFALLICQLNMNSYQQQACIQCCKSNLHHSVLFILSFSFLQALLVAILLQRNVFHFNSIYGLTKCGRLKPFWCYAEACILVRLRLISKAGVELHSPASRRHS